MTWCRDWLIVTVISVASTPQSCTQGSSAAKLSVGQRVSTAITGNDRCRGDVAPCRVFQVRADKTGVLSATLKWPKAARDFRLEIWNGNNGHGTCCRSGESVSVIVAQADRAEIRVVLATSEARTARHPFELTTAMEEPSAESR